MIPIMSTRSMSLTGLRSTRFLPLSLAFAPSNPSPSPSKRRKLDPTTPSPVPNSTETVPTRAEEQEVRAGYCCPSHSSLFDSDFDSEDEGMPLKVKKRLGKLTFLPEIPFEVKHYLLVKRDFRDVGTQPEEANGPRLLDLANEEVSSIDDPSCTVLQCRKHPVLLHLPEYTQPKIPATAFWNQFPDVPMNDKCPIECPHCNQRFSSGQALGGHTSRRHSSKKPTPVKRTARRNSALSEN